MTKKFTNVAAQGDFIIIRVNEIPADTNKLSEPGTVAHSETGHDHVLDRPDAVDMYIPTGETLDDTFTLWLDVKEETEIKHLRGHDTHEALDVQIGVYKIARQREYVSDGFRKAQD